MIVNDKRNASTMRSFGASLVCLLLVASKVSCESYSKACFLNYMLKHDLLDKTYQIYDNGEKVDEQKCELAINATINKVRSSSNDTCISNFLRRKYVSETLLKEYLIPQFKNKETQVHFDVRFTAFKIKAMKLSSVICNNPKVFKPDIRDMMRNARSQKDSKSKEIGCLQKYISKKSKLNEECTRIVEGIRRDFYGTLEKELEKVFAPPNDKLVNLKCSSETTKRSQMFEKISFFFVLSITRNMTDKQINVLLKGADGIITSSTRLIFECMIW